MVTTCRIIHSDLSDDGTFYAGSSPVTTWDPDISNLQEPLLSAVARTSQLVGAAFGLRFNADVIASGAALCATNLSKTATWRIQAGSGSPSVPAFDTGILNVSTSSKTLVDPDEKGLSFHTLFNTDVSAQDWFVTISDANNTDGFIEIGKMILGTAMSTTFGFWDGAEFSRDHNTKVLTSVGGTRFYNKHRNIRRWTLEFQQETYAKAWDEFDQMMEVNGLDRFVYIIPYPDDTERMHQHSFLGTFEQTSALRQLAHGRVSTGYDVVEHV